MAENNTSGYILIHRSLIDWEWYNDMNTKCLFIHCLLRANWQKVKWRDVDIERGSFVSSIDNLSKDTGLSVKQIRLSLDKLKRANNLTIKTTNKYSIVTVVKYDDFQNMQHEKGKQKGKQSGDKRATDKEINKYNTSVDWGKLLEQFNTLTGKKHRVVCDKTKRQLHSRLVEGYTKEDVINAIINCFNDPYHQEHGHKHLTLEFITRADKLDKYANVNTKFKSPAKSDRL